jgi:hypothetical protein
MSHIRLHRSLFSPARADGDDGNVADSSDEANNVTSELAPAAAQATTVQESQALISAVLDECSGHVGVMSEFPEGVYRYELAAGASPYSVDRLQAGLHAAS